MVRSENGLNLFTERYGKNITDRFRGKMVSFLDGNKDNCSIENLVLMDNAVNLEMNRRKLRFTDKDRTKTGMLVSELRVAVRRKNK